MVKVLFVNGQSARYWTALLRQTVHSTNGTLTLLEHQHAEDKAFLDYDVIILDADADIRLTSLIRRIRALNPQARIIVVSSTPHWRQAREMLLAGATDCARKVNDETATARILRGVLENCQNTGLVPEGKI